MRYFMAILTAIHATTTCPFTRQIDRDLSTFSRGITKSDMDNLKGCLGFFMFLIESNNSQTCQT